MTKRSTYRLALLLQLLWCTAFAGQPRATPAEWRQVLQTHAKENNVRSYTRTVAAGNEKVYLNSTVEHAQGLDQLLGKGTNVLQIAHFGEPGSMHTMALFDGEPIHVQYQGAYWRLRRWWGPETFAPSHWLYSSLIHLEQGEADDLRQQIAAARQEQGDEENAGPGWANGHIGKAFGNRGFNCASLWSELSLAGNPLWRKLGMRMGGGNPPDFQRRLETESNDRVFGHVIYGPREIATFGANPNANQFTFQQPAQ